jgi:hypothetical protein
LIGGLRGHELHRRPLHRFGDRLRITKVILLAVCTENSNLDVMMVKPAEDRV